MARFCGSQCIAYVECGRGVRVTYRILQSLYSESLSCRQLFDVIAYLLYSHRMNILISRLLQPVAMSCNRLSTTILLAEEISTM